jgi:putative aldouronate transport system substrate-binding protein
MTKNLKKLVVLLAMVMLVSSLFSGCGTDTQTTAPTTTAAAAETKATEATTAALEEATLNIVYPGDPPPAQDAVTAALEEATKDELNVKLNYTFIPWNDYQTKVTVMAVAGENIDILWTHPAILSIMFMSNSLAPLDDAIAKFGPDLTKNIDKKYWPPVTIKGKIYGVPAAQLGTSGPQYPMTVRKDLRVKYGLPEIKTCEDFEAFLAAVKKNNPELIPLAVGLGNSIPMKSKWFSESGGGLPGGITIDMKENKAKTFYEFPDYMDNFNKARDAFNKGYISKDVLSLKDFRAPFLEGKAAAVIGDIFEFNFNSLKMANAPGVELEFVRLGIGPGWWQGVTTWNFQSVVSASKNIDRAVMFLNWVQKDQKNYDLMTLGVEGQHYVIKDGMINLPDGVDPAKPPYAPYEWIWYQPAYIKDRSTYVKGFSDIYRKYDDVVDFVWEGQGFTFDNSTVKDKVAAMASIAAEYQNALTSGTIDPAKYMTEYIEKLKKAGIEEVRAEVQKQVEAWLAAKK